MSDCSNILSIFLVSSDWGAGYSGGGAGAIQDLNTIILKIAVYAGAVIVAIGITQLLISFHEQNSAGKTRAAVTVGLGIMFLTAGAVIDALGLNNTTGLTAKGVAESGLKLLAEGFKYIGIILAAIAVFQLVMAISNEDAREKADGTKTLAVGIVLYTMSNIVDFIKGDLLADSPDGATVVGKIFGIITFFARYVGIGFAAIGAFHLALAFKDGDGASKTRSALLMAAGAGLLMLKPFLNALNITV